MDGDTELRWRSSDEGDVTVGVEIFGDCRALEQLTNDTGIVAEPVLEDRTSSPLFIFPVSISLTIKLPIMQGTVISRKCELLRNVSVNAHKWNCLSCRRVPCRNIGGQCKFRNNVTAGCTVHTKLQQRFCFLFPFALATPLSKPTPTTSHRLLWVRRPDYPKTPKDAPTMKMLIIGTI